VTTASTEVPVTPTRSGAGGSLPVTGRPVVGLVLIGVGLVLLGASALGFRADRERAAGAAPRVR
jgi:hypothetical protein